MIHLRRLLFLIGFFLWLNHLPAQPRQHYTFSHIITNNGLVSNDVRSVQQDKKGFIWIATVNGLQRYDGQRFLTFKHNSADPSSIPNNVIHGMIIDKKDRLWLHLGGNRVGYVNVSDFTFHEVPVKISADILKRTSAVLLKDNDENIFFVMIRHSILTYSEADNEFSGKNTPFPLPDKWRPYGIYQDKKQNNYWIVSDSGLIKYNPLSKKISYRGNNMENDEIINAFINIRGVSLPLYDRSGRFWITSWTDETGGPLVYHYDIHTKKRTDWGTFHNQVRSMYHEIRNIQETDDGTVWIVGLNIMGFLSRNTNIWQQIFSNEPREFNIRYDIILNLFQDREKNIWVTTDRGLYRFNPSAQLFKVIGNQRPGLDSIYTPDVTDILQTKNGDILVGTWGNGTFTYNSKAEPINTVYSAPIWKGADYLTWALLERRNGDIWRACQGGSIFITSAKTKTTERITAPVFKLGTIRQAAEDINGNVWLGTHQGQLVKWNAATNTFEHIFKSSIIFRVYCDSKGYTWVCTSSDGVYRINSTNNSFTGHYTNTGPEGKKLMGVGAADIIEYNDSLYLIASESLNLLNIKTGHIRFYTTANGLPSNTVENIIKDKKGFIWLTTDSRLCRIKIETGAISLFNEEDGLPASSYNVASANMLRDGRIAIGRVHDFILFDPEKIQPDKIALPQPEITGFELMNSWLPLDSLQKLKKIDLKYNQNSVSIEFSTLTYMNHFPVSYMMKNLDKNWISASEANEAIYNYLPPGDYTFMLKTENGVDVSKITSLKISVRAPFWETWWFFSLLALVAALIFYIIDRERIRRKESLQKMRGSIAGNLHEEINTALNNINVLSEIARIKADKEPEQSKSYITEIHHKSHNMIIAMDDMLWSIDPANDSMAKTIARINEFADALRHRHNSSIDLQTDEKVISLKPDMKVRYELMLIYKLTLRLLVEEFGAKQIMIHLYYIKSQLQLNIFSSDTRLNESNNHVIKTIEEIRTRAVSINATLEFQSDEKGTAVILAVKTL